MSNNKVPTKNNDRIDNYISNRDILNPNNCNEKVHHKKLAGLVFFIEEMNKKV
jgi:hypothetical protein